MNAKTKFTLPVFAVLIALLLLLTLPGATAQAASPGTVVAWGNNCCGQTTVPAGLSGVTAIAAGGFHSLALKSDGTVVAWGNNCCEQTNIPTGLSGVTAIAAGLSHSLALKSDGTVVAWGYNAYGQTNVPAGLTNVIAITEGGFHNLALKSDGTVVAWGWNGLGQTNVPAGLNSVTAIAAGFFHSLALKSDGTVVAWGLNNYGQTNVPAGLNGVTAIAAGYQYSLALKSDGTVVAWGATVYGITSVPTGLSGVTAIAAGFYHSLALKSDGTVVAWGLNDNGQTNVPAGLNGVTAIAAGGFHNLALVSPDTTPPVITITAPTATSYLLNQAVTANYGCDDGTGSGVAACTGTVPNGANVDTGSVGAKSFTVNATDKAGNASSKTVTYNVIYNMSSGGWLPPVANPPALNAKNAGQGVPVQFSLSGNQGLAILAPGFPVSRSINCTSLAPTGADQPTVPAGKSGLQYDPLTNQYTYLWKMDAAWAGTCRQFVIRFIDGTEHLANFTFK